MRADESWKDVHKEHNSGDADEVISVVASRDSDKHSVERLR